jgi:hypothetical protein
MEAWLLERNVPLCDNLFKAQLYDLTKLNKQTHKRYYIDQILANKRQAVVRFPLSHPHFKIH